jgi:mannosyltransferase OCH1-like enzyme
MEIKMDRAPFTKNGIPKIIHQTWKTKDVPEKWKTSEKEWKRLHPTWIYHLWTDEEIRNHISTHHPDLLALHDSYPHNIQRADMIRYIVLHDFGGVYSDLDLYPVKNIESYLTNSTDYVVYSANSNCFTNALMIAKKGSPIHLEAMNALKNPKPWWAVIKHLHVMSTTGPLMFHQVMKNTSHLYSILPQPLFNPYSITDNLDIEKNNVYIRTLEGSSWHSWDSAFINTVVKYQNTFIVLGILLFFLIVFFIIYLIYKVGNMKSRVSKLKEKCGSLCAEI